MNTCTRIGGALLLSLVVSEAVAQHHGHADPAMSGDSIHVDASPSPHSEHVVEPGSEATPGPAEEHSAASGQHGMWMLPVGEWTVGGMAQLHPILTSGAPANDQLPIHDTEGYLTQPALMMNLESPTQTLVVRTTLNFEAWTQAEGEYTFGGWGEGFLDKRHPHTLLHEATVSLNAWNAPGGEASLTLGKGFVPYGTEDPMSRPVTKFPTNHHLSQLLERWLVAATYVTASGLGVEVSSFGGAEPEDAYDLGNIRSFGDSYAARVTQRFGGAGTDAPWEVAVSAAHVEEAHHGAKTETRLYNAAIRHVERHGWGTMYALAEASKSELETDTGFWSLLTEARAEFGRHRPYFRVEYATRPEYERLGAPGTAGFYRYDHGTHALGASRWLINSVGYEVEKVTEGLIARPFVELQYNRVGNERGDFSPAEAFGTERFWSVTTGFKLFLGGDSMRMGSYGVLDPMSRSMRPGSHMEHAGGH